MNLIRVITTKGCMACSILQDTLSKTLEELNRSDITVEYIDCQDLNHRQFINLYMITDFPTMVFIKDNEVLIQVKAAGVCGTDIHIFDGAKGASECFPPVVLGHEFAGVVAEIGEGVAEKVIEAARKAEDIGFETALEVDPLPEKTFFIPSPKVALCPNLVIGIFIPATLILS